MSDKDAFDQYLAKVDMEVLDADSYPIGFRVLEGGSPDMAPGSESVLYINGDNLPTPVNQAPANSLTVKSHGYNRIMSIRDSSNSFFYLPSTDASELPLAALDLAKPGYLTIAKFVRLNIEQIRGDRDRCSYLIDSLCAMERRTMSEGIQPREEQRVRLKALEYLSKCQRSDTITRDVYCLYIQIPINDLVLKRAYFHKGFNLCIRIEDPMLVGNMYVFNAGRNEDCYLHPHSEANDYHLLMDRFEAFRKSYSSTRIKIVAKRGTYFGRCGYYVQYDRIREIPITEPNDIEAEGIYVYRHDPLSREKISDNFYPITDAESIGIFRDVIEAESHAQKWRAKYIADKVAKDTERHAEETRQQDTARREEGEARKLKEDESKRKTERIKTIAAALGFIATLASAAYGIFKICTDLFSELIPRTFSSLFSAR